MQAKSAMLVLMMALAVPAHASLTFDMEDSTVRPVTKVVNLLQGMKDQLEKEAEEEAALMEKYTCWCKENGDATGTAVEEGTKKIKELESDIAARSALSAKLEVEIKNLGEDIEKEEASMDDTMMLRKKEVAKFQENEKDGLNNLNSVNSAMDTIAAGKSFLQIPQHKAIAKNLENLAARNADSLSADHSAQLASFLQNQDSAGPTDQIDGVLSGLKSDFTANLKHVREEEAKNKATYEKVMKAMREQIDEMKILVAKKKEEKTKADEEKAHMKQDIKDVREEIGAAAALAKEVKEKCFGKAKEWEVRQKTRAAETEAVSKAIEVLSNDDAKDVFSKTMNPSFLQLADSSKDEAARRAGAAAALSKAGLKDTRLATLALETKLDSFTLVKEKIDLMIKALKKEQGDEVAKKEYCTEKLHENRLSTEKKTRKNENLEAKMEELKVELGDAVDAIKQLTSDIEELKALKKEQGDEVAKKEYCTEKLHENRLSTEKKTRKNENLEAKMEELKVELGDAVDAIKQLTSDIEELKKQQKIAAQNREKENSEFQRVVQEQRSTQELLKKALTVLGEFYKKQHPALLQQPKMDPKEPETFGDYKKSKGSNGVMLMLQQLIADAKEMETESTYAEREAQADYEAFGKDTTADITSKSKAMADKEDEKAQCEKDLLETKENNEGVEHELQGL
eukprot:CAMPEP_0197704276 /NCGR_PEP_ID=MMETSP1338-20131121/125855_1 /TAXON_ID=43686 ORGANISM="Pelagodinium beii, Strain RCC1491" /NCGR_SAMPLE_ID=MMETSP1338 /ASSEMBLY_ACC=CAM_ASM_000754 /LENGTH=682 /DNA_ID=CAMNT_0043288175 /DNA_START=52 /DNA_END=2096 /DNA_ORIENTATION=-